MSRFIFFNDTGKTISIHPATENHGVTCDMSPIKHLEQREFILPDGCYAWVKQWGDNKILVSPTRNDVSDNNKPKHMGKYPIEFSFTKLESGKVLQEYLEEQIDTILATGNMNADILSIYQTLSIIKNQVVNHIRNSEK